MMDTFIRRALQVHWVFCSFYRSERAKQGESYQGTVKEFCREKGHGFIKPDVEGEADIFVHISE